MAECKHDKGFSLLTLRLKHANIAPGQKDNARWAWCCKCTGCAFDLNFDPDEFLEGIAIVEHYPSGAVKVIGPFKRS